MNTKVAIGVAGIIILLGAAVFFIVFKGGASGGYGPKTNVVVGGGSTSIEQLVAAGSPVVCTFATSTGSGSQSGTIYIADGMVAGDFTVNEPAMGSSLKAHMIVRDSKSYTWTSASSQGFSSTISTSTNSAQSGGVGYSSQMDYACQAWVRDSSKFDVPSDISFTAVAAYSPR